MKKYQSSLDGKKGEIHLKNASFNIEMINEDLFKIIEYMRDRLMMTWMDKYDLAKAYYKNYGNLKISRNFKTVNGYEYDENGVKLGDWIRIQKIGYATLKITEEKIKKLEEIGMIWGSFGLDWDNWYDLAKTYYDHCGNLKISHNFKTINGYEYNENGVKLGNWICSQRRAYKGQGTVKITEKKIKKLEEIGMVWDTLERDWNNWYDLAKTYYEYYGNLKIPNSFKTVNGYEYNENGVKLGNWICNQRIRHGTRKMPEERIKKLEKIGMIWYIHKKSLNEEITTSNKIQKNIELLNKLKSLLNQYDNNELPSKEEMNQQFIKELNRASRTK